MAFKLQFSDAQSSQIVNVAGCTPTSPQFLAYVNEATRRLMRRGNFNELVWRLRLCVFGDYITWPRCVETILQFRGQGWRPSYVFNNWYEFQGVHRSVHGRHVDMFVSDGNPSPIFSDITGKIGKHIRYTVVKRNDVGKTITLWGRQLFGQPLQHLSGGHWQMGYPMAATGEFVQTPFDVTHIQSVVRDQTEGLAYLWEWAGADDGVAPTIPLTVSGAGSGMNCNMTWTGSEYASTGPHPAPGAVTITQDANGFWHMFLSAVEYYTSQSHDVFGVYDVTPGGPAVGPCPIVMPTNAADGNLRLLAVYEPSDTNPQFRRSKVANFNLCQLFNEQGQKCCQRQVEVLVKLRYIPVQVPSDFLLIDNLDALKFEVSAIKLEEANDMTTAALKRAAAISELNLEDRDRMPDWQTPVHVHVVGGGRITNPI